MNLPATFDIRSLLDISPYLTKGIDAGIDAGNGVTLMVGDLYTYSLLAAGPLLILIAFMLVTTMYGRVKFFALEYGSGGFFGRAKAIAPFILIGGMLFVLGTAAAWLGWQGMGYSATLSTQGVHEVTRGDSVRYAWSDATEAADRIKSTEFWVAFAKDGHKCRLAFQQRYIGEKLQDKAIVIAEEALAYSKITRVK